MGHKNSVTSVALTFDGKFIVSGSEDQTIKIWEYDTGTLVRTLTGHSDGVKSVAVSSDGKYIVSGSWDYIIKIWNFENGV